MVPAYELVLAFDEMMPPYEVVSVHVKVIAYQGLTEGQDTFENEKRDSLRTAEMKDRVLEAIDLVVSSVIFFVGCFERTEESAV